MKAVSAISCAPQRAQKKAAYWSTVVSSLLSCLFSLAPCPSPPPSLLHCHCLSLCPFLAECPQSTAPLPSALKAQSLSCGVLPIGLKHPIPALIQSVCPCIRFLARVSLAPCLKSLSLPSVSKPSQTCNRPNDVVPVVVAVAAPVALPALLLLASLFEYSAPAMLKAKFCGAARPSPGMRCGHGRSKEPPAMRP